MSDDKISNIVTLIKELNVMDLCTLVKTIDKEFDLPKQQAVAQAAVSSTAASAEEKSSFNVMITSIDASEKITAIKILRKVTSFGLKELQEKVNSIIDKTAESLMIASDLTKEAAEDIKKEFADTKITVILK